MTNQLFDPLHKMTHKRGIQKEEKAWTFFNRTLLWLCNNMRTTVLTFNYFNELLCTLTFSLLGRRFSKNKYMPLNTYKSEVQDEFSAKAKLFGKHLGLS